MSSVEVTDDPLVARLRGRCTGEVHGGVAVASHTTLRVGGPARALVVAQRDEDLAEVGAACADERLPWLVVGRGSNLLVADAGFPGVVIVLGRGFRGLERLDATIRVGAAEPLPSVAVRVADAGFRGFAWACSVPGTIGGAVRMNAGAHGGEMADHLTEVDLFRLAAGQRETWTASALGLRYRHSELPADAVVVSATLALERGDPAQVRSEIGEIRRWRRTHQPLNEPNCGSVFTNPPGDSAGRLIDAAGLKGTQVGGAQVSERHANFIVTRPGATAADVATLIELVRDRVRDHAGVDLRPEVVVVGEVGRSAPLTAGGPGSAAEGDG